MKGERCGLPVSSALPGLIVVRGTQLALDFDALVAAVALVILFAGVRVVAVAITVAVTVTTTVIASTVTS